MLKLISDSRQIFKMWTSMFAAFVILILFTPLIAQAQMVYNDCYTASDFGMTKQDRFTIRPIGEICFLRCESECGTFSRKSAGIELNQSIIDKCNVECRAGRNFSSRVLEDSKLSPGVSVESGDIFKTQTSCATGSNSSASAAYNIYNTEIRVAPKQVIPATETEKSKTINGVRIKLIFPGNNTSNTIYLCGSKTVTLKPQPAYLRNYKWLATNYDRSSWNARNTKYYDTGIDMKDGDYISLSYGGQYRSCSTNQCPFLPADQNLFIKNPNEPSDSNVYMLKSLIVPGQNLQSPSVKIDSSKDLKNGAATYDDPEPVLKHNSEISFLGLKARTWNNKTVFDIDMNLGDAGSAFNGDTTVFSKDSYYSFYGILKGFSTRFATLAIAHPDYTGNWNQHLGGYIVNVTRKGCQFSNGQRLQYAIGEIDKNSDPQNPIYFDPVNWIDITEKNTEEYEDIAIASEGLLYLRIQPLPYDNSVTPQCSLYDRKCVDSITRVKSLYKPENTDGQYYVLVEQDDINSATHIISAVVGNIRAYLFGIDKDKEGVVQFLFNRFVADSGLVTAIQGLLLFYIIYTGLSFVIGTAQFTQKEALSRLVKIGIVVTLISPDSWRFFNDYLFKLFTDGALELLILLTASPEKSASQMAELLKNPTNIFEEFNQPFQILFGKVTWIKVVALIFSGPIGIIIAIIIAISGVIYAICIAKATLLYLISLVGIATLLLMAPIFISFVLFQFTKQMFDSWLKQLMSFTFQPIMVYVFIIIINTLILTTLKVVLGFTACRACWFSLAIPGIETSCIIPGYVSLFGVHNPDGIIGLPMSSIAAAFYFLILAQAMYAFTTFGARLANMLVMSSFAGLDLSNTVGKVISDTQSIASIITGVDRGGIEGGRVLRGRINWVGEKYDAIRNPQKKNANDDKVNKNDK